LVNFSRKKIDLLAIPKDNFSTAISPRGDLSQDLKDQNVELIIAPSLTYWWISFNMKDQLVGKNKLLRKAIAHAVNIDRYISVFTNNVALKANSIYPPGIPGYRPTSNLPYSYDTKKAKQYLAEAGYPEGKGLPAINYDVRGNSATDRQMADFIKTELGKIGIQVNVTLNTFPGFLKKAREGNLQVWQDGWALDYPDSENILQLLHSDNHSPGPNSTYYTNAKFDALFEKLRYMEDGPEKFKLMEEMEAIVNDDLPWVMEYYRRSYILKHQHLKNYRPSDLVNNFIKYLRVQ